MAMMDRLVVHPVHGQAWFFSACVTDALVQAATEWDECFGDLLDAYQRKEVRVLVRRSEEREGDTYD